jgi:p-hydroxybenzoate 3-monooxygenase
VERGRRLGEETRTRTQVGIVGGGPSGLLLSQLPHLNGIEGVVLEHRSREYVLARFRAGVLEQGFVKPMRQAGVANRMDREGELHSGFDIAIDGSLHHIDLEGLTNGHKVVVYGQTELTKDLYEARAKSGGMVIHHAEDVRLCDIESSSPSLT